jgi:hypothetical protein
LLKMPVTIAPSPTATRMMAITAMTVADMENPPMRRQGSWFYRTLSRYFRNSLSVPRMNMVSPSITFS